MDANARNELDTKISQRGQTLARLLIKRLSLDVQAHFPEARTVRLAVDEDTNTYTVDRVTGPHNRVVWQNKPGDRLAGKLGEQAAARIVEDATHYQKLAGARLHVVRDHKNAPNAEYSIHLNRAATAA